MRRVLIAAGCITALTACATGPAAQRPASPTPLLQVSPAAPAPTPSTLADLPVAHVNFSCRLPVLIENKPQYGWTGGFLTFPASTYQQDPAGVLTAIGDGVIGTEAQPSLRGYTFGSPFYDLAARRWVPASAGEASPDGSSYASVYPGLDEPAMFVDIVTVATGASRSFKIALPAAGVGLGWRLADYDGRYVYLVAAQADQFPKGVWRFDPASGALSQLLPTTAGHILLVQNGVAWLGLVDPADLAPPTPPKGEGFDEISSINLDTGASQMWIYRAGEAVQFWGLDSAGRPLVMVRPGPNFDATVPLVLVDSPGSEGIAIPAGFLPLGAMEADSGRLWFGSSQGIYYWTLATGLLKVYSFQTDQSADETMLPAGHCV